jgi:hypothetical protein
MQRDMRVRAEQRLVYHVFDLPWLNGEDLGLLIGVTGTPGYPRQEMMR